MPAHAEIVAVIRDHAGAANTHQKKLFADSLHAALTLDDVRALVAALGFSPDGVRQTTDRHWTWKATKSLSCSSSRSWPSPTKA